MLSFTVTAEEVAPSPYPLEFTYWQVGEYDTDDGIVYQLVIDTDDVDAIHYHWPKATSIVEYVDKKNELYTKCPPNGNERANIRVRFKYPQSQTSVPCGDDNVTSWCVKGGRGYVVWITIVESLEQLRSLWPGAWDVTVIADGMPA